jgi:hypothetical protein
MTGPVQEQSLTAAHSPISDTQMSCSNTVVEQYGGAACPNTVTKLGVEALGAAGVDGLLEVLGAELVSAQREVAQLDQALGRVRTNRTATDLLTAHRRVTQEHAFQLLRLASQHGHRELIELAIDVVFAGTTPPTLSSLTALTGAASGLYTAGALP